MDDATSCTCTQGGCWFILMDDAIACTCTQGGCWFILMDDTIACTCKHILTLDSVRTIVHESSQQSFGAWISQPVVEFCSTKRTFVFSFREYLT